MIFAINELKYDTDKMEIISEKIQYRFMSSSILGKMYVSGKDVKLYRSKKGNWLLTYYYDFYVHGKALTEEEAISLLLDYDITAYENLFGELEEA